MSTQHTGHTQPSIDLEEHRSVDGVNVKAVTPYVFNGTELVPQGGGLVTGVYDYIGITYPDSVTEVYAYRSGGAGGTLVATNTITYADAGKNQVSSIART